MPCTALSCLHTCIFGLTNSLPACLPPSSPCPQYTLVYPATPVANTYYETVPNCRKAVRALLGGTIVHYTGALVRGNPWLGCAQKKYAKVVLEVRPSFCISRGRLWQSCAAAFQGTS